MSAKNNKMFTADPIVFFTDGKAQRMISTAYMNSLPPMVDNAGFFDLSTFAQHPFRSGYLGEELRFSKKPSDLKDSESIYTYYVPFARASSQFINFPKVPSNSQPKLVFTGMLSGCAFIIAEHPTDKTLLRAFHDSRKIVSVDYDPTKDEFYAEYKILEYVSTKIYVRQGDPDNFHARTSEAFLSYQNGIWNLLYGIYEEFNTGAECKIVGKYNRIILS